MILLTWLVASGLIPTGVGNTGLAPGEHVTTEAHPHGRGEH